MSRSGVPGIVGRLAVPKTGEIPATDGKTTAIQSTEGIRIGVTESLATPLRRSEEVILVRHHVLTHESIGARNGLGCDLPNEDPLGGDSGDLKEVDVRLLPAPGHQENVTDLGYIR